MGNWRDLFPQSVGLLPGRLSFVILPYIDSWQEAIEDVLKLRVDGLHPQWEFFRYIVEGDREKVLSALERVQEEEVREFNRWVLTGECDLTLIYDPLLKAIVDGSELQSLKETRGDLQALIHLISAGEKAKFNRGEAIKEIDQAILKVQSLSPLFHANLLLLKAKLLQEKGVSYPLLQLYMEIKKLVDSTQAGYIKGDTAFQIGSILQSFGNHQEAVKYFQEALNFISKEEDSYTWALAHNNLALSLLSQPAVTEEDQVRIAMGIQHLKKALEVFTREEYPQEWASATLNYANALVYAPTGEPLKNLLKAVELYEEVLEFRKKHGPQDSLARVLANLGNTQAHLGRFKEALKNLSEAQRLFLSMGLEEEAQAVKELIEQIQESGGVVSGASEP